MVAIGDLVGALSAVTSVCAVNVALFDSPAAAMSAFAERVGTLTATMRLALAERDEAIAERDLAIEGLGSEVARLASILSNDHTNSGATTAVDRQSATGHRGPADGGEAESDAEACGEAAGANAVDAPDGGDADGPEDRPANTYNQREADAASPGGKRMRGGQPGHPGTTLGEDALLRVASAMAGLGLAPEWVDVGDPGEAGVTLRYRLGLRLVPTLRIFRCHGGCPAPVGGHSLVAYDDDLIAACCYLRNECNVTVNRIATLVADGTGGCLRPGWGTVMNFQYRLAEACAASVAHVVEDLLSADVVHTDASYVFKDGKCAYVRNFSTADAADYVPLDRKSLEALRKVDFLEGYHGILIHDHEVVMYHFGTHHGECIVHVTRYCRKVAADTGNDWPGRLAEMLSEANDRKRELRARGASEMPPEELGAFILRYESIVADGLAQCEGTRHVWARKKEAAFLRRLREYEAQHLLFLTNFDVDWSNNMSERDLRKAKRHSKVTGGFRDDRGMEAYCTTLTVTETMRRRGINVWEGIRRVLETGCDVFGRDAGPPGREQPEEQPTQTGQSDDRGAA